MIFVSPTAQISASLECMYDDAYTIQVVAYTDVLSFNFVAGMLPFLFSLIQDVSNAALIHRNIDTAAPTHRKQQNRIFTSGVK